MILWEIVPVLGWFVKGLHVSIYSTNECNISFKLLIWFIMKEAFDRFILLCKFEFKFCIKTKDLSSSRAIIWYYLFQAIRIYHLSTIEYSHKTYDLSYIFWSFRSHFLIFREFHYINGSFILETNLAKISLSVHILRSIRWCTHDHVDRI